MITFEVGDNVRLTEKYGRNFESGMTGCVKHIQKLCSITRDEHRRQASQLVTVEVSGLPYSLVCFNSRLELISTTTSVLTDKELADEFRRLEDAQKEIRLTLKDRGYTPRLCTVNDEFITQFVKTEEIKL